MYAAGARNLIVFNVPPMDRSPIGEISDKPYRDSIVTYNAVLGEMVSRLARDHPDVTVFLFDTHAFFQNVLDDPKAFSPTAGFLRSSTLSSAYAAHRVRKHTIDPICGSKLEEHMWLNEFHPTYPVHDALAGEVAKLLMENVPVWF